MGKGVQRVALEVTLRRPSHLRGHHLPETSHFTGTIQWVQIDIDEAAENVDHLITPEECLQVAMARQSRQRLELPSAGDTQRPGGREMRLRTLLRRTREDTTAGLALGL